MVVKILDNSQKTHRNTLFSSALNKSELVLRSRSVSGSLLGRSSHHIFRGASERQRKGASRLEGVLTLLLWVAKMNEQHSFPGTHSTVEVVFR